ncbi:hypothetical protein EKK58_02835 [Candidatus Dependentiae bacterium]|nr:MAG: hypothetical protein EKK58_02835 [Candidatus Dependentiae bacterium]
MHEDLTSIVALDTFIANIDRSNENLLYLKEQDRFYGIDQTRSLHYPIAHHCYERIKQAKNNGYLTKCPQNILECLTEYKKKLQTLYDTFSNETMHQMIDHLIPYVADNTLENVGLQEAIQCLKNNFEDNRKYVLNII